jgi:hypothetical protein
MTTAAPAGTVDVASIEELAQAVEHSLAHIERFELRYLDATSESHAQIIITLRPFGRIAEPIARTGWGAQRALTVFCTGLLAHIAMHIGDMYVVECMRAICQASLQRAEPARGDA